MFFILLAFAHYLKNIYFESSKIKYLFTAPDGVVSFKRQHIKKTELPRWDKCDLPLSSVNFHIDSKGTIDEDGLGLLQVDFANKYVKFLF